MDNQYWYEDQKQQYFNDTNSKKEKGRRSVSFTTLIVCMLITALLGGAVGGVFANINRPDADGQVTGALIEEKSANDVLAEGEKDESKEAIKAVQAPLSLTSFTKSEAIAYCAPSIVGIDIEGEATDYFGRSSQVSGSGSGIIISSDGYIVTNNHVIEGATKIKVYLYDDTEYEATVIGSDAKTDLAVIKIEAANLTPAKLGDSDSIVVGEDVVVIGNPLGEFRGSSTGGMISALARDITIENQKMTLLQTDAAVNPGNSGGGLFNMNGELIGVINAKIASTETEGLGFAIPVNDLKEVVNDLIDLGYVSGRAYLGVYTQDIIVNANQNRGNSRTEDFFSMFGMQPGETAVQVQEVINGEAAERAGIKAGDTILEVDGVPVSSGVELSSIIREYNAGDKAIIKVQRDGTEMDFNVTFGENIPAN